MKALSIIFSIIFLIVCSGLLYGQNSQKVRNATASEVIGTIIRNAFYVIGNPEMKLSNVRLAAGAPGSETHIRLLEDKKVDVILAGESQQWEISPSHLITKFRID